MIQEYIDYMQTVAAQHTVFSAQGAGIQLVGIDEAFGELITDVPLYGYYLRIVTPSYSTSWQQNATANLSLECALEVGKGYFKGDSVSMVDAMRDAEVLLNDIISRMVYDSRFDNTSWMYMRFNHPQEIRVRPRWISGDTAFYSIYVLFNLPGEHEFCIVKSKWTDL